MEIDWRKIVNFITCDDRYALRQFEFASERINAAGSQFMKRHEHFEDATHMQSHYTSQPKIVAVHVGCIKHDDDSLAGPLRFDVDVTDWAEYCSCECAKNRTVCRLCWRFANVAMFCLHNALRENYGFEDITIFFSGRRGFHVYVRDEDAFMLTNEQRRNVFDMLKYDSRITACMRACIDVIRPYFVEHIQPFHQTLKTLDANDDKALLAVCWPRIDQGPTTAVSHLLRCPFTKHGTTGVLVTPIWPAELLTFVPPSIASA